MFHFRHGHLYLTKTHQNMMYNIGEIAIIQILRSVGGIYVLLVATATFTNV